MELKHSILQSFQTQRKSLRNTVGTFPPGQSNGLASLLQHNRHQEAVARQNGLMGLPGNILAQILEYVGQYDLVALSQTCVAMYALATARLYRRITILLDSEVPKRYCGNSVRYVQDCGMRYMDSALVFDVARLVSLIVSLHNNPRLVQMVRFFVFDKCHMDGPVDIAQLQSTVMDFFALNSRDLHMLHITFEDFHTGLGQLTSFLARESVRTRIVKLFVQRARDLYPVPQNLSSLFLLLDEAELRPNLLPQSLMCRVNTLTCGTKRSLGLNVLNSIEGELSLRGLSVFHRHEERETRERETRERETRERETRERETRERETRERETRERETRERETRERETRERESRERESRETIENPIQGDTVSAMKIEDEGSLSAPPFLKLSFRPLRKIEISHLTHLFLKVDCAEDTQSECSCYSDFFRDFARYACTHQGLPNLTSVEIQSFPSSEWMRPHQMLEKVLTPVGEFVRSLSGVTRFCFDLSTPGFKMFDSNMVLTSPLLNTLNRSLQKVFFETYVAQASTLTTLQLPDFLTSFVYYRPDFYQSPLHACTCDGCKAVLRLLKASFAPMGDVQSDDEYVDSESAYYLVGYILGRLQADREVCTPIKEHVYEYRNYPVYKGSPHTLHHWFHETGCGCDVENDPQGTDPMAIDNLVTTYVVHQLRPVVDYLGGLFPGLRDLMVHGVYYERGEGGMVEIYDGAEYPTSLIKSL